MFRNLIGSTKKILSIFPSKLPNTTETSIRALDNFIVIQKSGSIECITNKKESFSMPTSFKTTLNGCLVKGNENAVVATKPISFSVDELNLTLKNDELKFKVEKRDEIFTLKHTVHVEGYNTAPRITKFNSSRPVKSVYYNDDTIEDAKLTFKTSKKTEERMFIAISRKTSAKQWDEFGEKWSILCQKDYDLYGKIDLNPGKIELTQFPMSISLQGYKQIMKIKESNKIFTIYHTVDLKVFKELNKNSRIYWPPRRRFDMQLTSGDLIFKTSDLSDGGFRFRNEVLIEFDLDKENQFINIRPTTKKEFFLS